MKEIPLANGKVAIVDDEDYELVSKFKWTCHADGYAITTRQQGAILMHILITGKKGMDHKDGNGYNNSRSNLREATRVQNGQNRKPNKNNPWGFKGATLYKPGGYYRAQIKVGTKYKHLGCFGTIEEAALAYDKAAIKYYGEFARLNFPQNVIST